MEYISQILLSMVHWVHFIAFGLLVLAGFNLPVSEDIVFIVSASIAATMVPENTYLIFAGCFAGAYVSDIIAYLIGRYGITRLRRTSFGNKLIPEEKVNTIKNYFDKYGGKTLFFGRFIPFGVRNVMFMTSGMIHLKMIKFLLYDLAALCFTSTILFSLGYTFGNNYKIIFPYLDRYKIVIFALFLLVIAFFAVKKYAFSDRNSDDGKGDSYKT